MSIFKNFASQTTKTFPPTICYDAKKDAIIHRANGVETDITDKVIAFNVSTLKMGWVTYVSGKGMVIDDGNGNQLKAVVKPFAKFQMPTQPVVSMGLNKKGKPARWITYACVDTLIHGSKTRCLFEMTDEVISEVIFGLIENATDKTIAVRFTGSEEVGDSDEELIRVPLFEVL